MRVNKEAVPLVEFMYLVFTSMPGESYRRRLRSLLLSLLGRGRRVGSDWQKPFSCCGVHENGNWFADTISLLLILIDKELM